MSRTPARFTQAEVARTIRAARRAGAAAVEVRPDGTIWVALSTTSIFENISLCGPRPPRLHREPTRHSTLVWYVLVGKESRARIKAAYGTPEFDATYRAALVGDTPPPNGKASRGTLERLVSLHRQSNTWRDLSLATSSPVHGKE